MRSVRWLTVMLGLLLVLGVREVSALDIDTILIFEGTERTNGTVDSNGYFFDIEVIGTGVTDGKVVQFDKNLNPTGRVFTLTSGSSLEYDNTFASMAALLTVHPKDVNYWFFINETATPGVYEDQVLLGFNPTAGQPTGYANITYPLHNATGVGVNPTYVWDNVDGFGDLMGMEVTHVASDTVVSQDVPVTDMTRTTWTPPETLNTYDTYEIMVAVGASHGGAGPTIHTTLMGDGFSALRVFADCNTNSFTTAPEPATLALVGTGLLVCIGLRRRYGMR